MDNPQKPDPVANIEAERQLLGRLLLNNDYYWQIADFLKSEHFYVGAHQDLYHHMGVLIQENQVANPVTLQSYIQYDISRKPAVHYHLHMAKDATSVINIDDYARVIVNLALRRKIISSAHTMIAQAEKVEVDKSVETVLQTADLLFSDVRLAIPGALVDTSSIETVCDESFTRLLNLMASDISPYPTIGLKGVTRLMGPLTPGCVYVIAGRPGAGKTAAAVAATRSIIRQIGPDEKNFGVAFFTLEVTKHDLWNRFVACEMALSHTPVDYMELKRGTITGVQLEAVEKHSNALKRFPVSIHDKSGLTVAEIFVKARAEQQKLEKRGLKLHVVVIDYLQIIKPSGRYIGNKVAEISDISNSLVKLAKDLNVAVLVVSQLSRKVEERNDKRPIMSDLRESGQIEQDANSILMLYRPAYYDGQQTTVADAKLLDEFQARENDLYYIVAKARDGMTGQVISYCNIGRNHIAEKQ